MQAACGHELAEDAEPSKRKLEATQTSMMRQEIGLASTHDATHHRRVMLRPLGGIRLRLRY